MEKSISKKADSILFLMVLILLVLVTAAFLLTNPSMNIQYVELYGTAELYAEDIYCIVADDLGKNILVSNLDARESAIEDIKEIKMVSIRRIFPDRIEVFVVEHEPVLLLNLDQLYGISVDNILIPFDSPEMIPDLPVISGLSSYITAESYSEVKSYTLDEIMSFTKSASRIEPGFMDRISEVNYTYEHGIILKMIPDGLNIIVGKDGQYENKLTKLIHSLPAVYCERERLKSVDLRFNNRVVLKYRDAYKG